MLLPTLLAQTPQVVRDAASVVVTSGATRLAISLEDGRYTLTWPGRVTVHEATSAVRLGDGRERWANDYPKHVCAPADVTQVNDALGQGVRVAVHHLKAGEPELVTVFWMYADRPEAYVRVDALSPTPIATDRMLPVVADRGVDLDAGDPLQILFVPFDNDMRVRYNSKNWSDEGESYEVGAVYDNASRHGLVVGSVEHDTWKSAVQTRGRGPKHLAKLYAYAGATGEWTHDKGPHGRISGLALRSPRFSIGAFDDWRDGMEAYGRANARIKPALPWSGGPPLGWNSWAAAMTGLNAGHVRAATGFVATNLKRLGFQYVNMDAFWDFIPDDERAKLVDEIHAAGLKAGIYWSPFAGWGDDLDRKVEGTGGAYTYRDIAMKGADGNPLPKIDNGWPLDPTHPGTRARAAWQYGRFRKWGFEYVKLDFLSHGALEGRHYDPKITTGIQAYNLGMRDAMEGCRGMFVSASIAPLFPHGYAHSRRVSCDTFADIGYSEYMLNSLTYGWWEHGTLYAFNDPDHSVVYKPAWESVVSETEGRTRVNASIAAGGMLLNGDDLTQGAAQARVAELFTKAKVLDLAKRGRTFRPVEGDTGEWAADAFVLKDGEETFLAVFNYSREEPKHVRLDLDRAGAPRKLWDAEDLWLANHVRVAGRYLEMDLAPTESALLRLDVHGPRGMRRADDPSGRGIP